MVTAGAVRNAFRTVMAVGGSTNAIIHLTAIAERAGDPVDLEAIETLGCETPELADIKPTGQHYMKDLHRAGGLTTVLRKRGDLIDGGCPTVTGKTLTENIAEPFAQDVVRSATDPVFTGGGGVGGAPRKSRLGRSSSRRRPIRGCSPILVRR